MHAALVHDFAQPPRYEELPEPEPGPGQVVLDVLATAIHPLVRSRASGRHYSGSTLPMVPGVDGVGRMPDGSRVYFTNFVGGTMAERVAVDPASCIPLPGSGGMDDATVAVSMNPAMSGWLAMVLRAELGPAEHVLVLGATGAAGRAAVALARHARAGSVIGVGRSAEMLATLPELGADATIALTEHGAGADGYAAEVAGLAAGVDVVIDYLWGPPAHRTMAAILGARRDSSQPLRWVQVGSGAGTEMTLPAAWLRSAAVELTGSGIGSAHPRQMHSALVELLAVLPEVPVTTRPREVPLSEVATAWTVEPPAGQRTVFRP